MAKFSNEPDIPYPDPGPPLPPPRPASVPATPAVAASPPPATVAQPVPPASAPKFKYPGPAPSAGPPAQPTLVVSFPSFPSAWVLAGAALLLLTVLGILLYLYLPRAVPDVRGQTTQVAASILRSRGFDVSAQVTRVYNSSIAADCVIVQSPEGGQSARLGSRVGLTVSLGPLAVPDVTGKTLDDAAAALRQLGLESSVSDRKEYSASPEGSVVRQSPVAGTDATNGMHVVVLTISRGRRLVPDVTDMPRERASGILDGLELTYHIKGDGEYDANHPEGVVIRQWPPQGTDATDGAEIALVLSRGSRPNPHLANPSVSKSVLFHNETGRAIALHLCWFTSQRGWQDASWQFRRGETAFLSSNNRISASAIIYWGENDDGTLVWRSDKREDVVDLTASNTPQYEFTFTP